MQYMFSYLDGADLIQAGTLRFLTDDTYEEWFWRKYDADFGDTLEVVFLKTWFIKHLVVKIDSGDESIEKNDHRYGLAVKHEGSFQNSVSNRFLPNQNLPDDETETL